MLGLTKRKDDPDAKLREREAALREVITSDKQTRPASLLHPRPGTDARVERELAELPHAKARAQYLDLPHSVRQLRIVPTQQEQRDGCDACWPAWDQRNGATPDEGWIQLRDGNRAAWARRFGAPWFPFDERTGAEFPRPQPNNTPIAAATPNDAAEQAQIARQHLADLIRQRQTVQDELNRLLTLIGSADATRLRLDEAKRTLAVIEEDERSEWTQWMLAGDPTHEKPLPDERRSGAVLEVSELTRQVSLAQQAKQDAQPRYDTACHRLGELGKELHRAIGEVLGSAVPDVIKRRDAAADELAFCTGLLAGLGVAMRVHEHEPARAFGPQNRDERQRTLDRLRRQGREVAQGYALALAENSTASLDIDKEH
jgi:hypothetical protein